MGSPGALGTRYGKRSPENAKKPNLGGYMSIAIEISISVRGGGTHSHMENILSFGFEV